AAVCHTRLDDDIRTHTINHFLHPNHVFGKLNDRPPHPAEGIRILLIPTDLKPLIRDQFERVLAIELELLDATVALGCERLVLRIYDYSHVVSSPAADCPLVGIRLFRSRRWNDRTETSAIVITHRARQFSGRQAKAPAPTVERRDAKLGRFLVG